MPQPILLAAAIFVAAAGPAAAEPSNFGASQTVAVGRVNVTFTMKVGAVEKAVVTPIEIRAADIPGVGSGGGDVTVDICPTWRCTSRQTVRVPVNGAAVSLDVATWPSALQARVRYEGHEASCCSMQMRPAHVVATTDVEGTREYVIGDPSRSAAGVLYGGIIETGVDAALLSSRPAIFDGFGAVVVGDGAALAVQRETLRDFVYRGGVLSLDVDNAHAIFGDALLNSIGADEAVAADPFGATLDNAPLTLRVPDGTRMRRSPVGTLIVRPKGASSQEMLAGVLAARPTLIPWLDATGIDDLPAVHAAAVAVDVQPPRALAFPIALVALVAIALVVGRGRKPGRSWRQAIAVAVAVGVVASTSLWALELFTVPAESHAHVITWTGPGAGWETGADAARPRNTAHVEVSTHDGTPLLGVTIAGDTSRNSALKSIDAPLGSASAPGAPAAATAAATLRSGAALVGVWSRPSPHPRAVYVDGAGDQARLVNTLDVPLDVVLLDNGNSILDGVPAHGSVLISSAALKRWDRPMVKGLPLAEERLVTELTNRCDRSQNGVAQTQNGYLACGAAAAKLKDGTLLGVEVAR